MNLERYLKKYEIERFSNPYQGIETELVGALGGIVRTSLVLGKPNDSEVNRKLIGVDFNKTLHGSNIYLEMENEDGSIVELLIPSIQSANFDHGFMSKGTSLGKFYLEILDNHLERRYLQSSPNLRDEAYFKGIGSREIELRELQSYTHRLFIGTSTDETEKYQEIHFNQK